MMLTFKHMYNMISKAHFILDVEFIKQEIETWILDGLRCPNNAECMDWTVKNI